MKIIKDFVKDKENRTLLVVLSAFATALVLVALFLIFMLPTVFSTGG